MAGAKAKADTSEALAAGDPEAIARIPLFAGLSAPTLSRLAATARVNRAARGTTLFRQGDEARTFYVLLDGQVGLLGAVEPGAEQTVVEILDSGEAFLMAAVLTAKPYLLGAMALAPCRLLEIPAAELLAHLHTDPGLAAALLASLSGHWRRLVQEVKALKLKSASQRLAHYLLGLTPRRRGSVIVRLPHNKSLIAARVGVRPETLSRAFGQLKARGVVVDGNTVAIADLARLGRYCQEGRDIV